MTNKIDELKQMEAFKELLEAKITGLKEEIEEEQEEQEEKKFPQQNDVFWYLSKCGNIYEGTYVGNFYDLNQKSIGNIFKTKEEAEFAVKKLMVIKELKEFSREFVFDDDNFYLAYDLEDSLMFIGNETILKTNLIYFESREKAREVIEAVGAERLKKYYCGIEE